MAWPARAHAIFAVCVARLAVVSATVPIHAPYGTNFGSWLCLEDWFFSGQHGRFVSTPDENVAGQGVCLPPGLPDIQNWSSEGLLVKMLNSTHGPAETAEFFIAHRTSYISTSDFQKIADLGIRAIRVPLTWATFADALAYIDPKVYGSHNPDNETVVVPDPFYSDTHALVTIPRNWLKMMIKEAGSYGLKVLLDLHAMPGGSSVGTYNSIWPAEPKFWTHNATLNKSCSLKEAGIEIARAMVNWVHDLDAESTRAVVGLTLMNEPGHLSASHLVNGSRYVSEPDILDWLAEAADIFRKAKLNEMGVKLYMNVIETAFANFTETVPPWFEKTFSYAERAAWAVADIHWYTAWSGGACDGRVIPDGAYMCDEPLDQIKQKLHGCVDSWAGHISSMFDGLKSCSEFSAGTYQDSRYACNSPDVVRTFLAEQVRTMEMYDIQPMFWAWRMPYGKVFEPGWSLKHLAGLEDSSAEQCLGAGPGKTPPTNLVASSAMELLV